MALFSQIVFSFHPFLGLLNSFSLRDISNVTVDSYSHVPRGIDNILGALVFHSAGVGQCGAVAEDD